MLNIGLIGCGYWGPNYIRIFNELEGIKLKYICDLKEESFKKISHYKDLEKIKDYNQILNDSEIDAVIIATPANSHYNIIKKALESKKHVLTEKPITLDSKECLELIKIAKENKKILMVAHTFLFNDSIKSLKEYINKEEFGKILHLHASRTGLGPIRKDVNSLWDLATHDISIFLYLLNEKPISVNAVGSSFIQKDVEDISNITLNFSNGKTANIQVSWIHPKKVREITVVGSKKMIVFNDISSEKITIYDKGVDTINDVDEASFDLLLREGDILIPKINAGEPLKNEVKHFLDCVINNKDPLTNGYNGYVVVKTLEAAQESMKKEGERIFLKFEDE